MPPVFAVLVAMSARRQWVSEIVGWNPAARPQQAARPRVTRAEFLESCDDNGKAVYTRIFDLADRQTINGPLGTQGVHDGGRR